MIVSTGIDLIEICRIKKAVEKHTGFLDKILTAEEKKQYRERGGKAETVAGIFAAKEAASKVLGTGIGKVGWHDIVVLKNMEGVPSITLKNNALSVAKEKGIKHIHISITHTKELAMAYAIGENNSFKEGVSLDEKR
ncbi:holo-ACP synthase [Tindallia californiensis]|uniref:Holo-[acyl-carrier-protein] synthase n=1 Tax=Tindallia californiensis TaxID=159292 RepID=A0A1H3K4J6_9FIRM|nr:holo-ACP synthase [Tindallia californiensis]SDY47112.1 holo-[acyl-carrier-protein] synthase [Tindallia californiensis]